MARDQKAVPKKKYESPKLLIYGDLTDMTGAGGHSKINTDNPMSKSMT
jgi:hypothetical protein